MKEFELINPSDPYTFLAPNIEVAALTVFCLSAGYGAKDKDEELEVPIFIFGGATEWYQEKFGYSPDDGLAKNKEAVANALQSMMYGCFEDRRRYQAALDAIDDDEKREKFIAEWQDGISSMNDIGTYAHRLAKKIKEQISEEKVNE